MSLDAILVGIVSSSQTVIENKDFNFTPSQKQSLMENFAKLPEKIAYFQPIARTVRGLTPDNQKKFFEMLLINAQADILHPGIIARYFADWNICRIGVPIQEPNLTDLKANVYQEIQDTTAVANKLLIDRADISLGIPTKVAPKLIDVEVIREGWDMAMVPTDISEWTGYGIDKTDSNQLQLSRSRAVQLINRIIFKNGDNKNRFPLISQLGWQIILNKMAQGYPQALSYNRTPEYIRTIIREDQRADIACAMAGTKNWNWGNFLIYWSGGIPLGPMVNSKNELIYLVYVPKIG